jgi:beta-glucosidase
MEKGSRRRRKLRLARGAVPRCIHPNHKTAERLVGSEIMPKTTTAATLLAAALLASTALAQTSERPWMNPKLSPDRRAALLQSAMTLDEEIEILHGDFGFLGKAGRDKGAIGSAGFVPGIARLGIPALQESDASLGVANPFNVRKGDGATPLPSGLATASTWNPQLAYAGGAMIGREAFAKGFNVLLSGGANVARDPRNGRNFEYLGEDPLLAGTLAGQAIKGVQSNHIVSTTKHFAVNDQETGRMVLDARIGEAAMRETDLLAFELAIEAGHPGSVMCAYNQINGAYACENPHLLNDVLKEDWSYPGWVMSDWGAVHSAEAATKGLDQESGSMLDAKVWFDKPLREAVDAGRIPRARVDDMVRRILRSMFADGLFDHPTTPGGALDYAADAKIAKADAEEGIVLLKNSGVLPLSTTARRIVVIGGHADVGVLSGGGSSQVVPAGGAALTLKMPGGEGNPMAQFRFAVYDPSSPLVAVKAAAPDAVVEYLDGNDPKLAAERAQGADAVIVFATQWMIEGYDAKDLSLPDNQDALIDAVAGANPHTVVVLETGNPVLTPWLDKTAALVEAWYPGAKGGEAIADILFGQTNPSGKLPITFPASEAELPRPAIPGAGAPAKASFPVDYPEGSNLGYRWYEAKGIKPLFPFGFGLSYTTFAYSGLTATGGERLTVSFTLKNTGPRAGMETAEVYAAPPGGVRRLIGWKKVALKPGESRRVRVFADPRVLAAYDEAKHDWHLAGGAYAVAVGASSTDLSSTGTAKLLEQRLKP